MITYGSSFGYVATAWAKRVPYYVQHLYEDHVYRDPTVIGGAAVSLQDRWAMSYCNTLQPRIPQSWSTPCYIEMEAAVQSMPNFGKSPKR